MFRLKAKATQKKKVSADGSSKNLQKGENIEEAGEWISFEKTSDESAGKKWKTCRKSNSSESERACHRHGSMT
jgi:hypothetical protein